MAEAIQLTFEEWEEKFNPHTVEDGLKLYETHGEEFEKVWATSRRHVWTIIEGDDGDWYIIPGISFVNRMNYLVCDLPRNLEDNYEPIKY